MSGFWTKTGDETVEPKRKFRFLVEVGGLTGAQLWYAKTADKPSFQISAAEHKYLNHTFYYPGSVTWQDVSLTLVDPGDPDVALSFSSLVAESGYRPPASIADVVTMSKRKSVEALGTVTVHQLNAAGVQIESWSLHNAWITELKYGDLEYGGDDLTEVTFTLKYDWASLAASGANDNAESGAQEVFTINSAS